MFIVLLFYQIVVVFSCRGGYYYYAPVTTPIPTTVGKDAVSRNIKVSWNGHQIPNELRDKWRDWLKDYNAKRMEEENNIADAKKNQIERGPGSGWPPSWIGFGSGFGGDDVPPWGFEPINQGLPDFCYLGLSIGKCKGKYKRWAFNTFVLKCVEFEWTGCDANANNFIHKSSCEKLCEREPEMDCDPTLFQYIEDAV